MSEPLTLPRPLAIRLLHAAQLAQPEPVQGWVLSDGSGQPARFILGAERPPARVWARLWSEPAAPAVPRPAQLAEGERVLVISLDTRGVLELRAWTLQQGQLRELVLIAAG